MTTEYIIVFITAPNEEEAAGIGHINYRRKARCLRKHHTPCPVHLQMAGSRRRRTRGLNDSKDTEKSF